jgi:hypothetical protein
VGAEGRLECLESLLSLAVDVDDEVGGVFDKGTAVESLLL